jgi:O-antigen/teichoic acid export membrane protein
MLVALSRIAVSTMFSPTAAGMHAREDAAALQNLFARATVLCFAGAIAVAIPLLLILKPLLGWFGEDFASGTPIARILIGTFVVGALFGPQQNLLVMTGHEWAAALSMAVAAVVSVIGCTIGIAFNGPAGAAFGFLVAMVVWNVAMAIHLHRTLHILPGLLFAVLSSWSSATGRVVKNSSAG